MTPTRDIPVLRHGFTLVELVLVMLIIGVVSAIAVPRFAQASARQRLDAAANRLIADTALARSRANAASESVTMSFDTNDDIYKVSAVAGDAFAVELGASPYDVSITSADFNGNRFVQFNAFGIPQQTGTVTISSSSGSVTLAITESGEATR
ncbi:MAG: prepilin-type N-terminal cleavage/methylation domain-containing protein [Phycisphaeraceae bacterium]|nr:prepilin-type N-terminal cleavage/methylation domain-containing protein [Phycisphaeraceae bacterium]